MTNNLVLTIKDLDDKEKIVWNKISNKINELDNCPDITREKKVFFDLVQKNYSKIDVGESNYIKISFRLLHWFFEVYLKNDKSNPIYLNYMEQKWICTNRLFDIYSRPRISKQNIFDFDNGICIRKTLAQVNFLCWLVSYKTILDGLVGACVSGLNDFVVSQSDAINYDGESSKKIFGSLEKSIRENSRFTETKILYLKNVSDNDIIVLD